VSLIPDEGYHVVARCGVSKLRLRIFDGSRKLFTAPASFLITITDGNRTQHVRDYFKSSETVFDLPFFNNHGDNYTVVVWAKGYKQAGFTPVLLSESYEKTLDIMLVPDDPGFSFADAKWDAIAPLYPFLAAGADTGTAATRYGDLLEKTEETLACILNLCEAMSQIPLSQGTPLDYIKQLRWDGPYAPAQDRFFAWCDPGLIDQVRIAAVEHQFAVENNPGLFHPGSTSSWKQIEFGEANVQLTFHENDKQTIGDVECIMVEPDIDYFRDLGAHAIFEVIPNAITHSLTNPVEVYVLRWIAGQTAGIPKFDPRYVVVS
jgi:hypothetical protein